MSSFQEVDQNLSVTEYKERLRREDHRKVIVAVLEYDYGLFEEFVTWNVLSKQHFERIKHLISRFERTVKLLDILSEQDDARTFIKFMLSLSQSFQEHLKSYITNNGYPKDGGRPLTYEERLQLRSLRSLLTKHIIPSVDAILNLLHSKTFISDRHLIYIKEFGRDSVKRTEKLLEVIECRCFDHYRGFLACLEIDNPTFMSSDFEDNAACVAVDSYVTSLPGETTNMTLEEGVIEKYRTMPYATFREKVERLIKMAFRNMSWNDLKVLLMVEACIRVYFSCSSLQSLLDFRVNFENGNVKNFLRLLFEDLLGGSESVIITHIFLIDFSFQEFNLRCELKSADVTDNNFKNDLLRNGRVHVANMFHQDSYRKAKERILLFAYIWRKAKHRKVSSDPMREAFVHLSSVCSGWWTTFKLPTFKIRLKNRQKRSDCRVTAHQECNESVPLPCVPLTVTPSGSNRSSDSVVERLMGRPADYWTTVINIDQNVENLRDFGTPISADAPMASLTCLPKENIGYGAATGYFYRFLGLILPDFCKRFRDTTISDPAAVPGMLKDTVCKLLIILPLNCFCTPKIKDGNRIKNVKDLFVKRWVSVVGNMKRGCKHSVYKLTDQSLGKEYYFAGELATPLWTMYESYCNGVLSMTLDQLYRERDIFCFTLHQILQHPNNRECNNQHKIIMWDNRKDTNGDFETPLYNVLLPILKEELTKERTKSCSSGSSSPCSKQKKRKHPFEDPLEQEADEIQLAVKQKLPELFVTSPESITNESEPVISQTYNSSSPSSYITISSFKDVRAMLQPWLPPEDTLRSSLSLSSAFSSMRSGFESMMSSSAQSSAVSCSLPSVTTLLQPLSSTETTLFAAEQAFLQESHLCTPTEPLFSELDEMEGDGFMMIPEPVDISGSDLYSFSFDNPEGDYSLEYLQTTSTTPSTFELPSATASPGTLPLFVEEIMEEKNSEN